MYHTQWPHNLSSPNQGLTWEWLWTLTGAGSCINACLCKSVWSKHTRMHVVQLVWTPSQYTAHDDNKVLRRKMCPMPFLHWHVCLWSCCLFILSHAPGSLALVKESFLHDIAKCHPQSQSKDCFCYLLSGNALSPAFDFICRATCKYNTIWEYQALFCFCPLKFVYF